MDKQNDRSMDRRSLLVRGGAVAAGAVGVTVAGVATAAPALAVAVGLGYTPITPYRSYDSRRPGAGGKIAIGTGRNLQVITDVKGAATEVPVTAKAVTFNLTITQTEETGYLGVVPFGTTDLSVSTINWVVSGLDLANGGTTKIAGSGDNVGSILVYCAGTPGALTHFIIDVTGYFA